VPERRTLLLALLPAKGGILVLMYRVILGVAICVAVSATAEADRSKQVRYVGVHPIAKAHGGGTCYIESPHVHIFPADKVQYRDHDGHNFFVGDPVAYGYDGPKHAYRGHHPIQVDVVVDDDHADLEFCYLDGPHYHAFEPEGPDFKVVGGAAFYVGTPPKAYYDARPAMVQINATYKPLAYTRPVVTVEAPSGWIGAHVDVRPDVVVTPPSARVDVVVPIPSVRVDVDVGVRAPVIIYGPKKYKKYKKNKKYKKWK
jgi:hypothetical protein